MTEAAAAETATPSAQPLVHAVNVTKSFHHIEVLKGIDLDVDRGQVVCLLGPSGSGKTTFLRCINQLETIDGGRIWVDGDLMGYADRGGKLYRLKNKEIAAQRREIGMVFQRFNLFPHMTAVENVAIVALVPTVVLAWLYTRQLDATRTLQTDNTNLQSSVEAQQAQLTTLEKTLLSYRTSTPGAVAPTSPNVTTEMVPYGEAPLAGARLERLREMLAQLRASNYRGKVKIATFVGDFCLTGNGIEGYSMAADDLPRQRCDMVGNPFEDSLPNAQRQSLAFANLVASLRQESGGALTVEVTHEGRRPAVPYPNSEQQQPRVTAGEWNRIAAQNNRVEFATQPAGS